MQAAVRVTNQASQDRPTTNAYPRAPSKKWAAPGARVRFFHALVLLLVPAADVWAGPPRALPPADPNIYAASVDTEVVYDNWLAQRLDGGYDPTAYRQFERVLRPYGTWVDDVTLGRVWVPSSAIVGADFVPYATNGTWVLTDYGWTWRSAWDWGWAPFHFGRWLMRSRAEWCWVPGTLWAPAWVAWRVGRDYAAWAPLPPGGVDLARPLGAFSPWRLVRARSLGQALEYLPPRSVSALFGRTAPVSDSRVLKSGGVAYRVNLGPFVAACGQDRRLVARALADVAPDALPRVVIAAHIGVPIASRPWVLAGVKQQTPIQAWPSPAR